MEFCNTVSAVVIKIHPQEKEMQEGQDGCHE